jgi:hypothetical protein
LECRVWTIYKRMDCLMNLVNGTNDAERECYAV